MSNEHKMHEAFVTLRRKLERAISRIVPPREIEDIVQETYVRVCQIDRVETIRHPRSFLYRVARNLALDHAKRSESRFTVSLDGDDEAQGESDALRSGEDVCDQLAAKQEFELFCQAVQQLPLQCRRVFVLRKVYGYSQKEIAQELDMSESTVEKHIAFGLKRCSYFLAARAGLDGAESLEMPGARLSAKRGK